MALHDEEPGEQTNVPDEPGSIPGQAPEDVSFELKQMPPAISPAVGFLVGGFFLLLVLLQLQYIVTRGTNEGVGLDIGSILLFLFLGVIGVAIPVMAYRESRRSTPPPPIRLGATKLSLPRSERSMRSVEIAYENLSDLQISHMGRLHYLIIGAGSKVYRYTATAFHSPQQISDCLAQLRARVGARAGGVEQLQLLDARAELASRVLQRNPIASTVLLGMIVVVFLAELHFDVVGPGAFTVPTKMIEWGANVPALVRDGQWYRLIAANFLHAGWIHAFFNGIALYVLGLILEKLIGHTRMLLVYLVSGLVGSAASALFSRGVLSVGASAAIFGLLGAYAMLSLRYRQSLPALLRQTRRWWVFILVINGALPLIVPVIDIAAHVGGFVAGALVMLAVLPRTQVFQEPKPPGKPVQACTVLLSGVFAAGLIVALQHAISPPYHEDRSWVLELILANERTSEVTFNNLAWAIVTDVSISDRELELARVMAERAVVADPQRYHYLDTLAAVCWRQGEQQRALVLERQALVIEGDPFVASQLARYLGTCSITHGPFLLGGAAVTDIRISERQGQVVELARPNDRGYTIYALDEGPEGPVALMRICWPAGTREVTLGKGSLDAGEIDLFDATVSDCGEPLPSFYTWPLDDRDMISISRAREQAVAQPD